MPRWPLYFIEVAGFATAIALMLYAARRHLPVATHGMMLLPAMLMALLYTSILAYNSIMAGWRDFPPTHVLAWWGATLRIVWASSICLCAARDIRRARNH